MDIQAVNFNQFFANLCSSYTKRLVGANHICPQNIVECIRVNMIRPYKTSYNSTLEEPMTEQKSWFKKALEKYDKFCEELGVNQGACRGCVPVVKFDPEPEEKEKQPKDKPEQS